MPGMPGAASAASAYAERVASHASQHARGQIRGVLNLNPTMNFQLDIPPHEHDPLPANATLPPDFIYNVRPHSSLFVYVVLLLVFLISATLFILDMLFGRYVFNQSETCLRCKARAKAAKEDPNSDAGHPKRSVAPDPSPSYFFLAAGCSTARRPPASPVPPSRMRQATRSSPGWWRPYSSRT